MKRTNFQLLPFQQEAVMQTVEAIYSYDVLLEESINRAEKELSSQFEVKI